MTQEYLLSPDEAGVQLDSPCNPTKTGWQVVTPESWEFRKTIADKTQTMDGFFDPGWYLDCSKAKIVMDVYEKNLGLAESTLYAMVLERFLEEQNIIIRPNELLVGYPGNDQHGILYEPRYQIYESYEEYYNDGKCYIWKKGAKKKVEPKFTKRVESFCKEHNIQFAMSELVSDEIYKMWFGGGQRFWEVSGTTGARANPDHEWYLSIGLRGLIDKVRQTIGRLEKESETANGHEFVDLRRRIVDCRAFIRATEAVINWIKRYAVLAKKMAGQTKDPKDKARLEEIASNCSWVAENPPMTFSEVMQLHWLSFMVHFMIEVPSSTVTFRPDHTFWKWYEKDVIKEKTITRTKAADLLANFMMKMHETATIVVSLSALRQSLMGIRDASVLTIGGQNVDGSDATNELSMLIIDVIDGYRLHFPDVKVRWHDKFNKNNFRRAIEVTRTGLGSPSIRNDNNAIPSIHESYPGTTTDEEAKSWAIVGCITPGIPINSKGAHRRAAYCQNIFKTMELALFNGRDIEEGWEFVKPPITPETGDATGFKTFDAFYQAWYKQTEWMTQFGARLRCLLDQYWNDTIKRPFLSTLYKRCVEEGKDVMSLDVPWFYFFNVPGWADLVDCHGRCEIHDI